MAEKILYFECRSGISGDMTVAALLDLGADEQQLRDALAGLPVHGYELEIGRRCSYGLAGCAFNVLLETAHCHHHDHDHAGDGEHHHHEHRNLQDILSLIGNARLTPRAREIAERTFRIVAEAEARAHGVGVEQVHFHEVGAVDSIVDIVAAAVCIDQLGVDRVVFSELTEGSGTVHCQHGELPVPVPAVLNIAAAHGLVLRRSETRGEMVTPTGAALAAALGEGVLPERFRIERTGVGVGSRDFGHPNILRAMLLTPVRETAPDSIWVLESNIDDATGEMLGLAMEKLFSAGARDVHFIPCFMKKNRPAYLLRVICAESEIPVMEEIVFRNTTTIGIRRYPAERTTLSRENITLQLACGEVAVKKCTCGNRIFCYPEYESVRLLAERSGLEFAALYEAARNAAEQS